MSKLYILAFMDSKKLFTASLLRMLAPLIKMLINNNVSYQELDKIIQRSYVEVAEKDFKIPNKKQSFSRIALLTGIKRKEVQKILAQIESAEPTSFRQNSALAVVSGWLADPVYKGLTLPMEGETSFTSLVTKYSGDIPVRATLDELMRVGSIERDDKNNVKLVQDIYVPEQCIEDKFEMISESARDLFASGEFNLRHNPPNDRMQLFVAYDDLSEKAVQKFKKMSDKKSLALLREYDAWLRKQDGPETEDEPLFRAGVGIYYFEEENDNEEE